MSRIEELIKEKCPDGVEFRKLEDCCNILDKKRKPVTKSAREAGEYPYYGANGIQDYVSDYIFDGVFVLVGEDGSVVMPNGTPVVTWAEGKIWVNNHAHIIEAIDSVNLRYMYYFLQTVYVRDLIHGNIPKLNQGDFRQIEIAVPPIEVQQEIVYILDKFIEIQTELQGELDTRKKQYEHYRDKLFVFDRGVELIKLGDVCKIGDGLHSTPKYDDNGTVCFINGNNLRNKTIVYDDKTKRVSEEEFAKHDLKLPVNTLLMSINGTIGRVSIYAGEKVVLGKSVAYFSVIDEKKVDYNYLYYLLQTTYSKLYYGKSLTGSSILNLGLSALRNYLIPIPPLDKQKEIVSLLQKFEMLSGSLEKGLPAEIEVRHKQYEYYRDKLLTFKRKVV